ncbi:MAG: class I SAM-dependent methyltransferase [archaeon]|nr:class I SAM-dependent methyltransferase [archaeon]
MDYKTITREAYDHYARTLDRKFSDYFENHVRSYADEFLRNLSGREILDLGSGPGNHAIYFKMQGMNPCCFDLSEEMVELY